MPTELEAPLLDFRLLCILAIRDEDDCTFMRKLFLKNREMMYRTAYSYVHNQTDAEDIVSRTCLRLIRNLDMLRAVKPFRIRAYVRSATENEAKMVLRRRKIERKAQRRLPLERIVYQEPPDLDTQVICRVTLEEVVETMKGLPEDDRDVLRMKFFDHLGDAEIAEHFDVCLSTVRSKISRARQRLHAALREWEDDDG